MSSTGAGSKRKGNAYERKTAKALTDWWGYTFNRTPGSGGLHWDDMRVAGDIVAPIDAEFPFVVECKHRETGSWTIENVFLNNGDIKYWWQQCVEDSRRIDLVPILMFTRNRSKDFVMTPYHKETFYKVRATGEPIIRTTVSYTNRMTNITETFDTLVYTLEGLTSLDPEWVKKTYTQWDWQAGSLIESTREERTKEKISEDLSDILGKLKNV